MKKANFLTSACRYCRFYTPEGRRGGTCSILGDVLVQPGWKACALAVPPFASTWESRSGIAHLEHSLSLNCSYLNVSPDLAIEKKEVAIV